MPVGGGEIEFEVRQAGTGDGGIHRLAEGVHLETEIADRKGQACDPLQFGGRNREAAGIAGRARGVLAKEEEAVGVGDDELRGAHRDVEAHVLEGEFDHVHRYTGPGRAVGIVGIHFETEGAGHRGRERPAAEADRHRAAAPEEIGFVGRSSIDKRLACPADGQGLVDFQAGVVELEGEVGGGEREVVDAVDGQFLELDLAGHALVHDEHDGVDVGDGGGDLADRQAGRDVLRAHLDHFLAVHRAAEEGEAGVVQGEGGPIRFHAEVDRATHAHEIGLGGPEVERGRRTVAQAVEGHGPGGGAGRVDGEIQGRAADSDTGRQAGQVQSGRRDRTGDARAVDNEAASEARDPDLDCAGGEGGTGPGGTTHPDLEDALQGRDNPGVAVMVVGVLLNVEGAGH